MKIRTLLLVRELIAIAAFVALNWSAIMTPTPTVLDHCDSDLRSAV